MARAPVLQSVRLLSDELHRGPWIYARQVEMPRRDPPEDGSLVEVLDRSERFLGHALWNGRSDIRLRWLSRGRKHDLDRPRDFLAARLRDADRLRRGTLDLAARNDAYRIAHAEGDDLPGLIVDRIGPVLVCEHHALGFYRLRGEVEAALAELYPGFAVLHRVPNSARKAEGFEPGEGEPPEHPEVRLNEEGITAFAVPGSGHKTGWFCDQRENRLRIAALARGRRVLDLFTNAGGFALQAARHGARDVVAVDLDEVALGRAARAARAAGAPIACEHADAFDVLRAVARDPEPKRPELVVVDPHKLVRGRAMIEEGKRKYADLNALALGAVRPGGIVASFSCSGALDLAAFLGIVFGAARRAEREVRLLATLEAAPDHPQRPDWPRSRYLKGALLAVDREAGLRRR